MSVIISQLDNGFTIATQTFPHVESVTFGAWIKTGSRNERPEQHGLSHLLEHMAFKGTTNFTAQQIAEKIENVGGEINATTSVEHTIFYARLLKADLTLGTEILADILRNPIFSEEELIREKHVILQELGASYDTPDDILYDYFTMTAYPNQALGRSILGSEKTITSFTPQNLRDHMRCHYNAQCMVICATGAVDHDEFAHQVEQLVNDYRMKTTQPYLEMAQYTGGDFHEERELLDTQMLIGFQGYPCDHKNFYHAQLLSIILGAGMSSRLFQELREHLGLCYSIHSFHWGFSDTGLFGINTATQESDIARLVPALVQELKKMYTQISETELQRAKTQYTANLIMSQEHSSARAGQIARQILNYGRPIANAERLEHINSITIEELQKIAYEIFACSPPTVTSIGKKNGLACSAQFHDMLQI